MAEVLTMPTAMEGDRLSQARIEQLQFMLRDARLFSKRAKTPEERIALAEIEHELLQVQKRWRELGLINGQEELPLAADRS